MDGARDVIKAAVRTVESVRDDVNDVEVFAREFGATSIEFEVKWWTVSTPLGVCRSKDQVISAVKSALDNVKMEVPFVGRSLAFEEPLPFKTTE